MQIRLFGGAVLSGIGVLLPARGRNLEDYEINCKFFVDNLSNWLIFIGEERVYGCSS
jgi:hypothetical protein